MVTYRHDLPRRGSFKFGFLDVLLNTMKDFLFPSHLQDILNYKIMHLIHTVIGLVEQ